MQQAGSNSPVHDQAPLPHAVPAQDVLGHWNTSEHQGLNSEQVARLQQQYGPNVLLDAPPPSRLRKVARQFQSLLVGILIVAAGLSLALGESAEAIAILAIVVLNALIGFLQEERAERALASLRKLAAPVCRVVRNGHEHALAAAKLVPGDIIHVEAGDQVAADARLLEAYRLSTLEAPLTGESTGVWKDAKAILRPGASPADRSNMIHAGTSINTGKGKAVVVATGMTTQLGRIAGMLERTESVQTPLQRRLAVLGRYLAAACLLLVGVIFLLNLARGHAPLEVFLFSVSLAVAAVPEGLPAVVTVALALGVRRMARRNALVRNLPAVETLGCVTVICSDKTGTLTRNEMTVQEVWTLDGAYRVTGVGYLPEGSFHRLDAQTADAASEQTSKIAPLEVPLLKSAITIGAVCNNARLVPQPDETWQVLGDPTEAALLVLALKAELDVDDYDRLHEFPFDSERKAMSVVVRTPQGDHQVFAKGAAESLLKLCTKVQRGVDSSPLDEAALRAVHDAANDMGRRALRVLALAWRPMHEDGPEQVEESELILVGLVGMIDPPREEVRQAVAKCREAGIQPVMITGDHPETALAVARDLQMVEQAAVVTGAELDELSDDRLGERLRQAAVFARVAPEHKLRIVRWLRNHDQVAAMTGDGVNDAPAVKAADIGVAMGRTGTDVTRGASDMVLLDDNFATIVAAIEEGRGIFDNIQKVTHYLLSCNAGELLLLFFAALIGWPPPLLAAQILWINLITDGVPALALGVEPPEPDVMQRPPRRPHEPLLSLGDFVSILGHGCLIGGVAAAGFAWLMGPRGASLDQARAAAFAITAFAQLFFALGCRSRRYTMPQIGWLSNPALFWALAVSAGLQVGVLTLPFMRNFLKTESLAAGDWVAVLVLSLIPVTVVEVIKLLRSTQGRTSSAFRA